MIATSYIDHEQLKLEHSKVMLLEETHESSSVQSGPALGVGRVGSRLGPQDLGGPQMPKIGPQLVAIKR